MRCGDDTEEAFPPRHPREPGGLRQDILDEIADHLACAAQREADRGGENYNEETVWGRVLERFGNPDAIARKLWWDEMRDTVMREWIQTGVMVVVAVAVVVFMALVMRQMTSANQAVLEALKSNATAVNPLVTLKVKVTRGSADGPAAEGVEVRLTGAAFGSETVQIRRSTDGEGIAAFGPMQPGQFEAFATDRKTGLRFESKQATLFAGQEPELVRITAPDVEPRVTNLEFSSPLTPGDGRALYARMETQWQGGGTTWEGRAFAIADGRGVRSLDPDITDDSGIPGPGDEALWKTLTPENAPLMVSGEIKQVSLTLISRSESGEQEMKSEAMLGNADIVPLEDGIGYRLELPPAFVKQFADWRIQDHAEERGIVLEERLWMAVRDTYPDFLVDSAQLVEESETGALSGNALYHWTEGDQGELIGAGGLQRWDRENGHVDCMNVSILLAPKPVEFPAGTRLLLALRVGNAELKEFENALQAWPVLNNVFDSEWPVFDPQDMPPDILAVELGPQPVAEQTNEAVLASVNRYKWILFDVTNTFPQADGSTSPQGLMLRWSLEEFGFRNEIQMVAAGAKQLENKPYRPMWLVLKPMAKEVTAAQ